MELRQLEHFVAAAEEGSFTAAARRRNIVQSGLSMSLRALEEELGTPLFVRQSRCVVLTTAGQAFLPEARRALAAVQSARAAVSGTQGLTRGALSVGISQVPPPTDRLVGVITEFRHAHPGVCLAIQQDSSAGTIDRVLRGEVDLGVCSLTSTSHRSLSTIVLATSELHLACSRDHRFATRDSVSLEEIAEEHFVDMHVGWAARAATDRAFESAGLYRHAVCEVNDVTLIVRLVEQGMGVSIIPLIARALSSNVAYVPLRPELPPWHLAAIFVGTEPSNVAAKELLRMLRRDDLWTSTEMI
ncbi:MAG TPA: LysR family transcriptional regulator [Gemmatimonadaceae bacterium]|jgi:DNA-binding transcriptional LysR family regulator|nr:LysR family transcriptional regulator [Gemmatimonadaceae bacterium]